MNIFKISQDPTRNKFIWVIIGLAMLIAGYGLYVGIFITNDQALVKFFSYLEEHGYTANRTLSGLYYPGNVIQIMEEGPDGKEQRLASPLVFLWHTDCFPDQTPQESIFALPELAGKKAASLQLKSGLLAELFPMLLLDSHAVADVTLSLQNQRLIAYAKADLNKRLAEKCKRNLYNAISHEGDKETWFTVILEAVIADSLKLEMQWETASSVKSRAAVTADAEKKLTKIARDLTPSLKTLDIIVGLETETEKKTVISAKGLVILGYRTRPIVVKILDEEGLKP